jgi:hypothetical protein
MLLLGRILIRFKNNSIRMMGIIKILIKLKLGKMNLILMMILINLFKFLISQFKIIILLIIKII